MAERDCHDCSEYADVYKICDLLFEEVKKVYAREKKLPNDLLSVVQFVCQSPLLPALDLVEKGSVTFITSQNKRELCQIVGTSGTPYICIPNQNYCSCPAYHYSVLKNEEYVMCKHVLAMRLGVAMEKCQQLLLSDEETSQLIQDMD